MKQTNLCNLWASCPDVSDPCACGENCGWNSDINRCVLDGNTTCNDCEDVCIERTCRHGAVNYNNTIAGFCPTEVDFMFSCQCDVNCEERGDCCFDVEFCPNGNIVYFLFV